MPFITVLASRLSFDQRQNEPSSCSAFVTVTSLCNMWELAAFIKAEIVHYSAAVVILQSSLS